MDSLNCDRYNQQLLKACETVEEDEELYNAVELVSQQRKKSYSQVERGMKRAAGDSVPKQSAKRIHPSTSRDISGISLVQGPSNHVKLATDAGLVIFCWGDDNNDKSTIQKLKHLGLHAVIYDKLDQYITKEVKESIFLMEARESQRDIMRLAALESPSAASVVSAEAPADGARPYLDLAARQQVAPSTVTSLDSLASTDDEDRAVKRNRDIISCIEKESQVKEQRHSFQGLFPAGDSMSAVTKKSRKSDAE